MRSLHQVHPYEVVVTHALRTPIGRFLGAFADLSAVDLGVSVTRDLMARSGLDPQKVDEVFYGNGRQAGGGPNPARQIAIRSELPETVPATTLNMACGSGLQSLILGAESIRSGRNRVVLAGGTESMSGLPYFLPRMRRGYRLGHDQVVDGMTRDGFLCPLADMKMGATAELLARELSIPRASQDEYALESQRRCSEAVQAGRFAEEISPVEVVTRKQTISVEADEHPRPQTSAAALAKLPPVFDPENGSVTAGNSSGITDGASSILLMERGLAEQLGYEVLAVVGESRAAGVDPRRMGIGPVPAVRALESANGIRVGDYDLIELNEAFAAQVLACDRDLELPMERVNVNGGAIALGHPIGATGARIVVTLLSELRRRGGSTGLATLCISGGMGLACAFHRDTNTATR